MADINSPIDIAQLEVSSLTHNRMNNQYHRLAVQQNIHCPVCGAIVMKFTTMPWVYWQYVYKILNSNRGSTTMYCSACLSSFQVILLKDFKLTALTSKYIANVRKQLRKNQLL
jgi:transcription elongation factor Elf1